MKATLLHSTFKGVGRKVSRGANGTKTAK